MKVDTWMPLYTGELVAETLHLTAEQFGAYMFLIVHYWRKGQLPSDDETLATITRLANKWPKHRAILAEFFDQSAKPGFWVHGRIERELVEAKGKRQAAHDKAVKAAGARHKHCVDDASSNASSMFDEGDQAMREHCPPPSPHSSEAKASSVPEFSGGVVLPLQTSPTANTEITPGARVWLAYAAAYQDRYGVPPLRDAHANAEMAKFAKSVPEAEAPAVAAWYVRSNEAFYVKTKHPPATLRKDAAKLRTEWATRKHGTETAARQADQTAARGDVFRNLIEEFHGTDKNAA